MSLAEHYTEEIRTQLKRFAAWEPNYPIALGDYGELRGARFHRLGNLSQLGVSFDTLETDGVDQISYSSEGGVDFSFKAGGSADLPPVANGKAALELTFKAQHAVMFNAADVRFEAIDDQVALGRDILKLYADGRWDAGHSVVVEVTRSGSTTVVISRGQSASILLLAEADVPNVDLADASIKLSPSMERDIGHKVVASEGLTPLFSLSRVRPRRFFWWRRPEFRRQLGFQDLGGDDTPPRDFGRRLQSQEQALVEKARAEGLPFEEAFEMVGQQPAERPAGGGP